MPLSDACSCAVDIYLYLSVIEREERREYRTEYRIEQKRRCFIIIVIIICACVNPYYYYLQSDDNDDAWKSNPLYYCTTINAKTDNSNK